MRVDLPAKILISGSTGSGKTHYLLNMLEEDCMHVFDVIFLTQQLTSIAKPYRKNTAKIVAFYDPDEADMITLLIENLSGISKAEKDEIIQTLKNNKHARIEISHRYPFTFEILR